MKNFIDPINVDNRSISPWLKFGSAIFIKKRTTKNKKTMKLNFINERTKFDLIMFRKK